MKIKVMTISNILYYISLGIILILLSINLTSKSDALYKYLGIRNYVVLSGSMEPEIMIGDLVIVKNIKQNDIKIGDVVTFKKGDNIITHRVIEKINEGFITKGDNNNVADGEVLIYSNIVGKVIKVIPKIGYIISFFSRPTVVISMLITMAIWVLYDGFIINSDKESILKLEK